MPSGVRDVVVSGHKTSFGPNIIAIFPQVLFGEPRQHLVSLAANLSHSDTEVPSIVHQSWKTGRMNYNLRFDYALRAGSEIVVRAEQALPATMDMISAAIEKATVACWSVMVDLGILGILFSLKSGAICGFVEAQGPSLGPGYLQRGRYILIADDCHRSSKS